MRRSGRFAAGLIVAALFGIMVYGASIWAPDLPVDALKPRWAPPPSQFVGLDGMEIHLRDEGWREDPAPILLLHGTSSSLFTWDGWVAQLASEHRVLRIDLPGFGLTGPFPDDDYHMAHYVAFLGDLLDRLHLEQVILAGNSFGGDLAWHLALAQPGRVRALILVDASGYKTLARSVPIGFRLARLPYVNRLMQVTLPRSMIESSLKNVYADPNRVTPALVDQYVALTRRAGNRRALVQRFGQIDPGEDQALIPALSVPTLILWGEEDHLIPPENAEHFQRDIRDSQLRLLTHLGHVPQEEDPVLSSAPVKEFLRAVR